MATKATVEPYKIEDTGEPAVPGYEAWKRAKIERSLAQAKDRDTLIPAEEVWRSLGLER